MDLGVSPLSVGGDHSVTDPILKAVGRERPVGMNHFDAHCDTGGAFDQTRFHHGGPFRLAVLESRAMPARLHKPGAHQSVRRSGRHAGSRLEPQE